MTPPSPTVHYAWFSGGPHAGRRYPLKRLPRSIPIVDPRRHLKGRYLLRQPVTTDMDPIYEWEDRP